MKVLRLISMVVLAVAMSAGLTACDQNSDITGKWEMANVPNDQKGTVEFSKDGVFTLANQSTNETYSGNWSRNGDNIYLAMKGEEEVGKVHILSVDRNSLVLDVEGETWYLSRSRNGIANGNSSATIPSSYINGHGYVDLGLSVKWATCNVGASSPSDYGDYFAWGEASTKSSYTEENSKTYGVSMGDIAGNSSYDAARANWGGTWRLPTEAEIGELVDKCKKEWTSMGGHNGYKVTGPSGNSIFLPAAGWRSDSSLNGAGVYGNYWSSTPFESDSRSAYFLYFYSGDFDRGWNYRFGGPSVRPVSE